MPGVAGQTDALAELHASTLTELTAKIQRWLQDRFTAEGADVRLRPVGTWGLDERALPDVAIQVERRQRLPDGWQVDLRLEQANQSTDKLVSAASARFRAIDLVPVWVAAISLKPGDTLSCSALRLDKRPSLSASATWTGDCGAALGLRLRHALQPGDVLSKADLAEPGAVLLNQEAIVITRLGGIEIQTKAMVLADGYLGQRVPVRLQGQDQTIQATVIAPGTLQVLEGL